MARLIGNNVITAPQGMQSDYLDKYSNRAFDNPFDGLSQIAYSVQNGLKNYREISDYEDEAKRKAEDYEYTKKRREVVDAQNDKKFTDEQYDRNQAALDRKERADEIESYVKNVIESGSDEEKAYISTPEFKAVTKEYIMGGSSGGMLSLRNIVENAKLAAASKAEAEKEKSEAAAEKAVEENLKKRNAELEKPHTKQQWENLGKKEREELALNLEKLKTEAINSNLHGIAADIEKSLEALYEGSERKSEKQSQQADEQGKNAKKAKRVSLF